MKGKVTIAEQNQRAKLVLIRAMIQIAEDYGLSEYVSPFRDLLNGNAWSFFEHMSSLDWRQAVEPRAAYLLHEVFSKADFLDLVKDREWAAQLKYWDAEESCSRVNGEVSWGFDPCTPLKTGGTLRDVLFRARRKIGQVLGDFDATELLDSCEFGPGASVGIPRRKACLANKIGSIRPTVTTGCRVLASYIVGWNRAWFVQQGRDGSAFVIADAARVTTVPKNSKVDRMICVEPLMNSYIQRGIGVMIRSRLGKVGIDLQCQEVNQYLAYVGSVRRTLATVDLSSASDTISIGLVDALFARDWFEYMNMTRTAYAEFDDQVVRLEKFSAMGNGYTFEVESLIFYSLAWAVADMAGEGTAPLSVYGDDIILSSKLVPALTEVFSALGFTLNADKTFSGDDPFRESCGKHYLDGVDMTPFYFRSFSKGWTSLLLLAANNLKRWSALGDEDTVGYDGRSERAYNTIVAGLPERMRRPTIPDGVGDGALFGDRRSCRPRTCPKGRPGLIARSRIPIVKSGKPERDDWAYLAWLHRYSRRDSTGRWETTEDDHLYEKFYSTYWVDVFIYVEVTPWPESTPWLSVHKDHLPESGPAPSSGGDSSMKAERNA